MFLGFIVACGFNVTPLTPGGCALVTSKVLYPTEQRCVEKADEFIKDNPLPDGRQITDRGCVRVTTGEAV